MRELEEAIQEMGYGIGQDIVQAGRFLNHRIDTRLLTQMGAEIARHFQDDVPELVMTVEASGIALAVTAAQALNKLPVLFIKKTPASNQRDEQFTATVHSYTHGTEYEMRCAREYLPEGTRVLIVDDFLADGEAVRGMMSLIQQAGAAAVGVAVAIEKGFQQGGKALRAQGVKLLSLSVVREIRDGKIILDDDR